MHNRPVMHLPVQLAPFRPRLLLALRLALLAREVRVRDVACALVTGDTAARHAVLWARVRFEDTGRYLLHLGFFAGAMAVARNEPFSLGWTLGSPAMEVMFTTLPSSLCLR